MKIIETFKNISKKDIAIAGGKGASLGEMMRAGFSVPGGFVILASAFDKFLKETDINVEIDSELSKVNYKDVNSVNRASNVIRDLISDALMPVEVEETILKEFDKLGVKYVAVRSSATVEDSSVASWAGELETYLNITRDKLLKNVKKCWSSLFTPRAIFYHFEKGLDDQHISVAVIIQKMIQSKVSGVCFTVHPVTKDKSQMVIEACSGLGEKLVSGKVTPDTYVIDKQDLVILDINLSNKRQKLSGKQIIDLAKLCIKIENHYQFPQDIEWAFAKNKFHILQSRPITTL